MRVAALDIGAVRVGLAVSDEMGLLAHPRPFLQGKDPGRLVAELQRLCNDEQISLLVIGLPRSLDGRVTARARRIRAFSKKLSERTGVPVELLDERFSTHEARARLREQGLAERQIRGKVDSAAAAVLLQSYLDHPRESDE